MSIGTSSSRDALEVVGNTYYSEFGPNTRTGPLIRSPNGNCYVVTVDDNGQVGSQVQTCPDINVHPPQNFRIVDLTGVSASASRVRLEWDSPLDTAAVVAYEILRYPQGYPGNYEVRGTLDSGVSFYETILSDNPGDPYPITFGIRSVTGAGDISDIIITSYERRYAPVRVQMAQTPPGLNHVVVRCQTEIVGAYVDCINPTAWIGESWPGLEVRLSHNNQNIAPGPDLTTIEFCNLQRPGSAPTNVNGGVSSVSGSILRYTENPQFPGSTVMIAQWQEIPVTGAAPVIQSLRCE